MTRKERKSNAPPSLRTPQSDGYKNRLNRDSVAYTGAVNAIESMNVAHLIRAGYVLPLKCRDRLG
jgi:hypothetical protein